jgi:rhodanese-related sulfurtransferase
MVKTAPIIMCIEARTNEQESKMKDKIRLRKLGFSSTKPWFRFWSVLVLLAAGASPLRRLQAAAVVELSATDFYERVVNGMYDVIADVRTTAEFNEGHIRNSTLVESLADAGSSSEISVPADLAGCEKCSIIVYCRSGRRADVAMQMPALRICMMVPELINGQRPATTWKPPLALLFPLAPSKRISAWRDQMEQAIQQSR